MKLGIHVCTTRPVFLYFTHANLENRKESKQESGEVNTVLKSYKDRHDYIVATKLGESGYLHSSESSLEELERLGFLVQTQNNCGQLPFTVQMMFWCFSSQRLKQCRHFPPLSVTTQQENQHFQR